MYQGRMTRPARLVTEAAQSFSFTRRAMLLGAAQWGVGALLVGRMGWLAIGQHEHFDALAQSNRARLTLVPPRRGWIVDRKGLPIAINRSDFRVDLIPDRLVDPEATIARLRKLLGLSDDEVARIRDDLDRAAGFQPVQVAEDLDWEQFARVNVALPDLPGVAPARGFSRNYPAGAAVAHLTGYVGSASAEDYRHDHNPLLLTPGFKTGKQGLERSFEPYLRGKPGGKRSEVSARGRLVRELKTQRETPGHTLQLTIDAGLQDYLARRIGPDSGAAVVIDCANGDILAMASMPAYDPNSFSRGITHDEWNRLSADDHMPLLNKTLQGLYPPGSTVKPMNALALLAAGVRPEETVSCSGRYKVGNSWFHCWQKHGHGSVDMRRAIAQSCDIYFYAMARRIGTPRIAAMARTLGLGQSFPLPFASQRYGTVPDPAWKLRKYHKDWTVPDTLNSAIGQGYTLVNPLQLGVMAARIASGRAVMPRLVRHHSEPSAQPLGLDADQLGIVHTAMRNVVNGGGTAGAARLHVPGVEMAGKTGSAQVRRISMSERASGVIRNEALAWKLRDHGLFLAFAPVDQPRYAIGVVLEHGGHGAAAAVIARDAMTYLFDPAGALRTLEEVEYQWGGTIADRMARQADAWRVAKMVAPARTEPAGDLPPPPDPPPTAAASADAPPAEGIPDNGTTPADADAGRGPAAPSFRRRSRACRGGCSASWWRWPASGWWCSTRRPGGSVRPWAWSQGHAVPAVPARRGAARAAWRGAAARGRLPGLWCSPGRAAGGGAARADRWRQPALARPWPRPPATLRAE